MTKNTTKSGPLNAEKDAQALPKQVCNNFEKVQKTTFFTSKLPKMTPQISQKWSNFV